MRSWAMLGALAVLFQPQAAEGAAAVGAIALLGLVALGEAARQAADGAALGPRASFLDGFMGAAASGWSGVHPGRMARMKMWEMGLGRVAMAGLCAWALCVALTGQSPQEHIFAQLRRQQIQQEHVQARPEEPSRREGSVRRTPRGGARWT